MSVRGTDRRLDTAVGTVRVCKFRSYGTELVGLVLPDGEIRPIPAAQSLASALEAFGRGRLGVGDTLEQLDLIDVLAPVDRQELWSADRAVWHGGRRPGLATRPALFSAGTSSRVAGPADELVVRRDSVWTTPTFELALWLDGDLTPIGLGLANDLRARDIEDGDPSHWSQARVWGSSCALGPAVLPTRDLTAIDTVVLDCSVDRGGGELWSERVEIAGAIPAIEERIAYLGRDNVFPDGAILLTGAGVAPPVELSLQHGDVVTLSAEPLGVLSNRVRVGL